MVPGAGNSPRHEVLLDGGGHLECGVHLRGDAVGTFAVLRGVRAGAAARDIPRARHPHLGDVARREVAARLARVPVVEGHAAVRGREVADHARHEGR